MKLPHLSLNELFRLPGPALAPALAGAASSGEGGGRAPASRGSASTMLFASGPGDGDYDGYDDPPYDDPPQSTRRAPGAQRGGSGGAGNGGSRSGGRQRSIQFQPEERYWTEYLRIALPIIGLLLMIGLFWYWASQLAGDDDNGGDEPIATEAPGAVDLITPASTPEPTQQVVVPPTSAPEQPPPSTPEEQAPPQEEPTEEPPPEETDAGTGGFAVNDAVVVTEDGLNLRSEATTSSDSVATLSAGDVLTIQGGPAEADGFIWYQVIVEETADVGWVADEFIEPAQAAE